jgi:hypothetical protein
LHILRYDFVGLGRVATCKLNAQVMHCYVSLPHEITMLSALLCVAPTALEFILQPTHTSGFLPKTRESGAFWGPFACARLQCGLTCGRASAALGASIHQHRVNRSSVFRRRPKMFSRELPDAAWHGDNLSGSFDSSSVRFAPSEFAQDDRG